MPAEQLHGVLALIFDDDPIGVDVPLLNGSGLLWKEMWDDAYFDSSSDEGFHVCVIAWASFTHFGWHGHRLISDKYNS